jgi:hypothetical protein
MAIPKLKEVVSRRGIKREIEKARRKLSALEKDAAPRKRDAILRQMLQLEVCETVLNDYFIIP